MDLKTLFKRKIKRKLQDESNLHPLSEVQVPLGRIAKSPQQIEDAEFQRLLRERGKMASLTKTIPKFFNKLPGDSEPLRQKLREESRSNLLKRRSQQLLDTNELNELWILLNKNESSETQLINYGDFQKVAQQAGNKVKPYFKPSLFAKLQQGDPQGRISIISLFNYLMRKMWLDQTRVGLSVYDSTGQGYLTETEIENYITELLPTLCQLDGLEKSFHNFYLCTAVRKFLFFLDGARANRVRILDILACSFLDDLLELRDENLSKELQEQNWFSVPSTLRIYGHYLNLDRDHNGMLSRAELASYGSGTLTKPFLDRVFQTCLTYGGEMDYKTYLDLVLALENRAEPQALTFLFKILDIKGCGYLDAFTLNYFFRAIQDQMKAHGTEEPVSFSDVKDELFDMVRPKNPESITLADLLSCGQGDTFVSILIDFHGFWAYEHREAISSEPQEGL
ncbi:serine/threonine-protein phosphatase 2A regulatory subunit B'' subunit gamma-like [Euwallacea similis]|uniref:serine/threonine-protein phosphatase 2A regulatory subunit B'' subunit gamma-like n=1 Tax=Euwallacea similis TaxID=1736056 RepID=UPI00344D0DA9